jgi:TolA-binding protein
VKKFIALALVMLAITASALAQWIVCDPANTVQSVINSAQEIAKFVEMVNNQVQQIETLADQLNRVRILRKPVRRSQGGRAHDNSAARHRPEQDLTRRDADSVRILVYCWRQLAVLAARLA